MDYGDPPHADCESGKIHVALNLRVADCKISNINNKQTPM